MTRFLNSALILAACFALAAPASAQVQQWTPESEGWTPAEREVWDALVTCLEAGVHDTTLRRDCLDADYIGFGADGIAVPRRVTDAEWEEQLATMKLKWIEATPLHILVHGELAVIQYVVFAAMSDPDGDTVRQVAWTDVMRKTDGMWRWITDHGHMLE